MPHAIPDTVRQQAHALVLQGVKSAVIAQQLGIRPTVIRNWSSRYGWLKTVSEANKIMVAVQKRSETSALRQGLLSEATLQVDALKRKPVKDVKELLNTPDRQGRAALLKTLVESVSLIEDWDASRRSGLILANALGAEVDVSSTVHAVNDSNGGLADAQQPAEPQQIVDSPPAQPAEASTGPDQPAG